VDLLDCCWLLTGQRLYVGVGNGRKRLNILGAYSPDDRDYDSKPCVKEWLARHRQFRPVPVPAYSPDLNLIERLWKSLRKKALNRWLKTFGEMQAAAGVLARLGAHRDELSTLMTERFAIVEVEQAVA
jgi:hypothetical protein